MPLIKPNVEPAEPQRPSMGQFRSRAELAVRDAAVTWGREKWPSARVCHELVVDRGDSRADLAFIGAEHFVVAEVKSGCDTTGRLLAQMCAYVLCAPEVWLIADRKHANDTCRVSRLFPSVGILLAEYTVEERQVPIYAPQDGPLAYDISAVKFRENVRLSMGRGAMPFEPDPECMLSLLWVRELAAEARRHLPGHSLPTTHRRLVNVLMKHMTIAEMTAAVCRQLRQRDALWVADPVVPVSQEAVNGTSPPA